MSDAQQNKPVDEQAQQADGAYEAPKVTRVSLRPDEAVLGHCKISGVAGPVSGGCVSVVSCRSLGS
jgi:hypothetical protein